MHHCLDVTARTGATLNFFDMISSVIIPRWIKFFIAVVLALLIVAYIFVGYAGLMDIEGKAGWIEATAYILGMLLPALLIGSVILFAETGIAALRHQGYRYLSETIPASAVVLAEGAYEFTARPVGWFALRRNIDTVSVLMRPKPGGHFMLYEFVAPANAADSRDSRNLSYRKIIIGVELNVKKANIIVHAPADKFAEHAPESATPDDIFPHTLAGARNEGYTLNNALSKQTVGNVDYIAFVLYFHLSDKFLVRSNEKLYFAQDLMLMIKAFLNEAPQMFEEPTRADMKKLGLKTR